MALAVFNAVYAKLLSHKPPPAKAKPSHVPSAAGPWVAKANLRAHPAAEKAAAEKAAADVEAQIASVKERKRALEEYIREQERILQHRDRAQHIRKLQRCPPVLPCC